MSRRRKNIISHEYNFDGGNGDYVQQRMSADGFNSPDEVVHEALRRMMAEDHDERAAAGGRAENPWT